MRAPLMKNKQSTARFLMKALPIAAVFSAAALYLTDRYSIGIDPQASTCLPWRVFVVDKHDKVMVRGEIYAFKSQSMEPFFKNGTQVIKYADGVPGDRVKVTESEVTVNGVLVGEGVALSEKLKKPPSRYVREEIVPPAKFWFMGRTKDSFDSRYWGYVGSADIIGRAYPIW